MSPFRLAGRLSATLVLLLGLIVNGAPASGADPALFVPGRILVRFRPGAEALRTLAEPAPAGRLDRPTALLPRARGDSGRAFGPGAATGVASLRETLSRTSQVPVPSGETVLDAVSRWSRRADVEYAGPVHLIPVEGEPGAADLSATGAGPVPADPDLPLQWHHDAIGSRAAWAVTGGDSGTVIGVIDTGVDYRHPDLAANVWSNRAEALGLAGIDDDGNGYIDDVVGFDFTDVPEVDGSGDFKGRDPDPSDDVGHGTWVAGVACATGNNGVGGAGVAFGARFMALRAGFRPRTGFSLGFLAEDDAAAAVLYAVDNGASVINLSFGDQVRAPILEDAVRYAVDRGVVVVAAAGNSGTSVPFYPAALSGVLAVGASDRDGRRASYSTWGSHVGLLAPGSAIYTTDLGSGYTSKSGTSLASPVAAGAAALIRSLHPDWSSAQVIASLLGSARAAGSGTDAHGARFLDIGAGVASVPSATITLSGLDAGDAFDQFVPVRGTVQGPGVRGWRVLARRTPADPWKTLGAASRGQALDETLASWNVSAEPEGPAQIRVEALAVDRALSSREVSVTIDHSPPEISNVEWVPVLSGPNVGVRFLATSNEDVLGTLMVTSSLGSFEFHGVTDARDVILGLDGPLSATGEMLGAHLRFENRAGLSETRDITFRLPQAPRETRLARSVAPGARTWLPRIVDLDKDGVPEVVGETSPVGEATYGDVVAYSPGPRDCKECPDGPLEPVWESHAAFIPQDAADFDGDGFLDVLGLALQQVRVYSRASASGFPGQLRWSADGAWPALFIPAPDGPGFDIVASRDNEIRIYRREGADLQIRQSILNPTGGINSISPAIVSVRGIPGTAVLLATVDGDNDLIVLARDPDGEFRSAWSGRLEGDYASEIAAADVNGDGKDEIVVMESVGSIPSPAAGLRDGLYRLHVLRWDGSGAWVEVQALSIGAAGQFSGNPVSLAAARLTGSDRDGIWWGVNGRLYLVAWQDESPVFRGVWDDVGPGRPAVGDLSTPDHGPRPVAVFPGDASGGMPGALIEDSPLSTPLPVSLGLRLAGAAARGPAVEADLRWNAVAPPFTLTRTPGGDEEPDFVRTGLATAAFRDTTLVPGATYLYAVRSEAGGPSSFLAVAARVRNTVVSARAREAQLEIVWEFPIRATERSTVEVPGVRVTSALLDRTGTRLTVRWEGSHPTDPPEVFALHGYESDPAFTMGPPDSSGSIVFEGAPPALSVRSVRVLDRNRLALEFEPVLPDPVTPGDLRFEPPLDVAGVSAAGGNVLDVRLDPGTPLTAGSYRVYLSSGLHGGAASVRPGFGDALAFSVTPVVFPNPVRAGQDRVTFQWLPVGARVSVFDLNGRVFWTAGAPSAGDLIWDLNDGPAGVVAPGIYLFRIEGLTTVTGKLAVVR